MHMTKFQESRLTDVCCSVSYMAKSSIRLLQKISSPSSSTISSRFFLFRSSPLRWPALTSNTAALSAALPCNLSAASGDNHSLEQAFSSFGEIVKSKVINDRETGRSRGFGFVTFKDEQAMRDAIERMNDQDLDGRSITVNEAQSRSGGGGGNGDGYGAPRRDGGGGGGYGGGGRDHGFGGGGGGGGGGGSWYLRGNGASDGNCRS